MAGGESVAARGDDVGGELRLVAKSGEGGSEGRAVARQQQLAPVGRRESSGGFGGRHHRHAASPGCE